MRISITYTNISPSRFYDILLLIRNWAKVTNCFFFRFFYVCWFRVWYMHGCSVIVCAVNQSIILMTLTSWSLLKCVGGISSANSQSFLIQFFSFYGRKMIKSPISMSFITASCQPLVGGVSSSLLVVMAHSSECWTHLFTSSCTLITCSPQWDQNTRNICGGKSI